MYKSAGTGSPAARSRPNSFMITAFSARSAGVESEGGMAADHSTRRGATQATLCTMLPVRTLAIVTVMAAVAAAQAQGPASRAGQTPPSFMGPCSNMTCEIENDWTRNNVLLLLAAGAMPENKYGFKPVPEEQSFGERVLHVAQINLSILQELGAKAPAPKIDPAATSKKIGRAHV